jgi:hypothetical protein
MTPAGIEPATFRFVAQHLKHCATAAPKRHLNIQLFNPLNAELNPTCHLLALFGAHRIFHVSGLRVNGPFFIVVMPVFYLLNFKSLWFLSQGQLTFATEKHWTCFFY